MADMPEHDPREDAVLDAVNIQSFTLSIIRDLEELRAGKISVREAHARAELAKQALKAVGYILAAQKFLAGAAREVPALPPGGNGEAAP